MLDKLKTFSELVVLPHTVFALPFALASLLVATGGKPSLHLVLWVVAAMFFARTAAMAYNRLVDADVDAKNPRTQNRPIPAGKVTVLQTRLLVIVSSLLFIGSCAQLNRPSFMMAPLALGILFFYSHTKRFTWASHFFLGLALGVAPVGAWVAATGRIDGTPFWLTLAVICFVAGFDILYATQDALFDKSHGLHSWVVKWGAGNSLIASRILHGCMLGFLAGFGAFAGFPQNYYLGVGLVGGILVYQHKMGYELKGDSLKVSPSLMKVNGWVAVAYLFVVGASLWH